MATGMMRMKTAAMTPAPTTPESASVPIATTPGRAAWYCLGAALASGGLLYSCFHPVAWGFLGWVALAPLLILVRTQTRPLCVYLFAYLAGLAFYLPALSWMSVAHSSMVGAWIALAFYMSLYFPVGIAVIRAFDRRNVPLVVSVPQVWVALEYFRCHFLSGFPWYLLAHTQHDYLPMIQIADLGGVFGVSLVVAVVNAIFFDWAYQFPEVRDWFNQAPLAPHRQYASVDLLNRSLFAEWLFRRNLLLESAAAIVLLIGVYSYGVMRMGHDKFYAGPTVCLLQSNIDQRLREGIGGEKDFTKVAQTVNDHFKALCTRAAKNHETKPDLIIWPETSFPDSWIDISPKLPLEQVLPAARNDAIAIRKKFHDLVTQYERIPHLVGMNSYCQEPDAKWRHYNSALLLNDKGQVEARFDKVHRVPFGEYIPLKDWLPFLAWLSPYDGDFGVQPGTKMTRFKLNKHHFGVLICYEDTIPFLARRYVETTDDGPPVDFLVNISNDGWFDGSAEHEEHLAVCRFRAIECRRAMVRAVNMGVSAVVDSNGRVLKPTFLKGTDPPVFRVLPEMMKYPELPASEWHKFKKTPMVLKATVPIDVRSSIYAQVGDVLPIGCWVVLVSGAAWVLVRRKMMVQSMA